ncbi:MAG: VOC family protein [Paracoccaceae bacterium]
MKQRIAAVSLVVPDYDIAIGFYVDRLGFRLVADQPQGPNKRWVLVAPPGAGDGTALLLARADSSGQTAAVGNQSGGRVFLFLETDDFARDHARMRSVGVEFEEDPRNEPYGTVAVWRDPFGNRWDLVEFAG